MCAVAPVYYNNKSELIAVCYIKFVAGYPVCTTLGQPSSALIDVLGKFSSILKRKSVEHDWHCDWTVF